MKNLKNLIARYTFAKQGKLVLGLQNSTLRLVYSDGKKSSFEKVVLREMPDATTRQRISSFLQGKKPYPTCLVLSRADVLQKELAVTPGENGGFELERKLKEALPYNTREMAYGLLLGEAQSGRGLIMALPEKQIHSKLVFLENLGLSVDEVITEDQALSWLIVSERSQNPALIFDQNEDRLLVLLMQGTRLYLSRVFDRASDSSSVSDLLSEISLSLLEYSYKPEKIFLSGLWDPNVEAEINKYFLISSERLSVPEAGNMQLPLFAALDFDKRRVLSLLPNQQKIKRWKKQRDKLYRETALAAACLVSVLIAAFGVHTGIQQAKLHDLDKQISGFVPAVKGIQEMVSELNKLRETTSSKGQILEFLKELNIKAPSALHFGEMRIEGDDFYFKAESSSHAAITEMVQVFEKMGFVQNARLENTRLRKKLNEDFYEFEIVGKWKN
jgi:hypothetical protein